MEDPFFNYEAARIMFEEIPVFLRLAYALRYGHRWPIQRIAKELSTTKQEVRTRIDYTRRMLIRTEERNGMILKHLETLRQIARERTRELWKEAKRQRKMIKEGASLQECFSGAPEMTEHQYFMFQEESPVPFDHHVPDNTGEFFLPERREGDENHPTSESGLFFL